MSVDDLKAATLFLAFHPSGFLNRSKFALNGFFFRFFPIPISNFNFKGKCICAVPLVHNTTQKCFTKSINMI